MSNWFVAFKVDPDGWYNELLPHIPAGLRVFHPDDLHMTVAFLGNFDVNYKQPLIEAIDKFQFKPIALSSQAIIVLPSEKRYSAVCLDFPGQASPNLHQNQFLESLNHQKDEFFKIAHVAIDTRPFLAHVTFARPPRKISFEKREELLEKIKQMPSIEIQITLNTIALYTWADHRVGKPINTGDNDQKIRQFKVEYEKVL